MLFPVKRIFALSTFSEFWRWFVMLPSCYLEESCTNVHNIWSVSLIVKLVLLFWSLKRICRNCQPSYLVVISYMIQNQPLASGIIFRNRTLVQWWLVENFNPYLTSHNERWCTRPAQLFFHFTFRNFDVYWVLINHQQTRCSHWKHTCFFNIQIWSLPLRYRYRA